jgi:ribosomal subunit interface protein
VDIVVKGRNVEVTDHLRRLVEEKLAKADRYDQKIIRIEVELRHERNPRQSDHCQRVEITCWSRGPVVRAEAGASEFATALDEAVSKLHRRLRRAAERRRALQRRVRPAVAAAPPAEPVPAAEAGELSEAVEAAGAEEEEEEYRPWRIVREKQHPGDPMTVEDALFQMELLGHDFYLFLDKETGRPSVVYRRRAYDYGVISLGPPSSE